MSQRITNIRCQKKKKVILRETCSCFLILTLRRESPPTHRCESEAKEIIQPNFKFWELWILKIPHIYLFLPHCPSFSSGLLLTTQAIILFIYFLNYLFIFRMYFLYFTILYWFCHTSKWICHGCTHVPHPEPPSHIPPCTIPLGHPNAPALSILYHTSNLNWRFTSHMLIYMFQSILLNRPTLTLSHRVQKTVLYICVSFAVSHRFIVTIFLNSIYMH